MKYEARIVAFIDILGFGYSVEKSLSDHTEYDKIFNTLNELKAFFLSKDKFDTGDVEETEMLDTQVIQVSDSLIISRLVSAPGGVFHMLTDCAFAIHLLINNGYLCRGAIKYGYAYHRDSTIFGEACIRAFKAEEAEKLPIVKFDNDLLDVVKYFPGQANVGYEDWEIEFIKKDCEVLATGEYYLNYFTDYDNRVGGGEGTASEHYIIVG